MASLQRLCRLNIKSCFNTSKLFYSTQLQKITNVNSILAVNTIKNPWIWQKQTSIESPLVKITPIELPKSIFWIPPKTEPLSSSVTEIRDPELEINKHEKQTVKLIVIRRHKMRKHKLKKLRKKMKFEWAKRRQRREMRKEKSFQSELLAQISDAESFSAENYVAEKLKKATEIPIPRFWKGKRLPEFLIREKLGLPPK
ncbi:Pyruvate dehydrogenase E1 beta subunit [Carabus blaptoides fortunei]